ncbi:hypothetical protein B0H16DRAFT_1518698 [Mycena metata]|uniref:F-box domain-containing protein n=1 Tax=Mycena metata TaxID=1033252 RepID=A0AAD7NNK1_9AGAR|nr:hypothetical protein B0H16DRAFT_1518698 [Mycena metata]
MSLTDIPQELIDNIITMVRDFRSLKACSLVGRIFRYSSQRILLQSMTLSASPLGPRVRNFSAARTVLEDSPHIAQCVLHLNLFLCHPGDFEDLPEILRRLVNVVSFSIQGSRPFEWSHLTPGISAALFSFLSGPSVQRLHMERIIGLPGAFVVHSAGSLSFNDVQIANDIEEPPLLDSPTFHSLMLRGRCGSIYNYLSRPALGVHLSGLRRLSINPQHPHTETINLITAVAASLEHLHFTCSGLRLEADFLALPALPTLRTVSGYNPYTSQWISGLAETITSILTSGTSPLLEEILLAFPNSLPELPIAPALALDAAICTHPASPSIRWRVMVPGAIPLAFAEGLGRCFPDAQARGRVLLEKYVEESQYGWPFFDR